MYTYLERGTPITLLPLYLVGETYNDGLEHLAELQKETGVEVLADLDPESDTVHSFIVAKWPLPHQDEDKPEEVWIDVINPDLDPELAYWAVLHEYAHVIQGDVADWATNKAHLENQGPAEARAWLWAFSNGRFSPSEKVLDQVYYKWFGSYFASPLFSIDDPDIAALLYYLEVETVE